MFTIPGYLTGGGFHDSLSSRKVLQNLLKRNGFCYVILSLVKNIYKTLRSYHLRFIETFSRRKSCKISMENPVNDRNMITFIKKFAMLGIDSAKMSGI